MNVIISLGSLHSHHEISECTCFILFMHYTCRHIAQSYLIVMIYVYLNDYIAYQSYLMQSWVDIQFVWIWKGKEIEIQSGFEPGSSKLQLDALTPKLLGRGSGTSTAWSREGYSHNSILTCVQTSKGWKSCGSIASQDNGNLSIQPQALIKWPKLWKYFSLHWSTYTITVNMVVITTEITKLNFWLYT